MFSRMFCITGTFLLLLLAALSFETLLQLLRPGTLA